MLFFEARYTCLSTKFECMLSFLCDFFSPLYGLRACINHEAMSFFFLLRTAHLIRSRLVSIRSAGSATNEAQEIIHLQTNKILLNTNQMKKKI